MNVYDFDNTIYDGESVIDFFIFCLQQKVSLIRYVPIIFYTAILYKLKLLPIERLYDLAGKVSSAFTNNQNDVSLIVNCFWKKKRGNLKYDLLKQITKDDIIITASPQFLINGILNDLPTKNIVCSDFNIKTGKFEFVCYRQNKVLALTKKYPNIVIDNFYTDSLNDRPIMEIAQNSYLIKKNRTPVLFNTKLKNK